MVALAVQAPKQVLFYSVSQDVQRFWMKEVQLKWIKGKVFKISLLMRYNFSLEKIKGMKTGLFRRFIDTLSFFT